MLFLEHLINTHKVTKSQSLKTLKNPDKDRLQQWVDTHNSSRKRKSNVKNRKTQRSTLEWAAFNIHEIVPMQPAVFGRPVSAKFLCGLQRMHIVSHDLRRAPEKARPHRENGSGRQDPLAHHGTTKE